MPCTITQRDGFIFVAGHLDESADFSSFSRAGGTLKVDFRGLEAMNSVGLSRLLDLMQFRAPNTIEFHGCPKLLIDAVNNIPRLLGANKDPRVIKSLFLPYICGPCRSEVNHLAASTQSMRQGRSVLLPPVPCPRCGTVMRLGVDPDDYFTFLLDP